MTDGGEVKVTNKVPINIRRPIPLPAFIVLNGRKLKTKLAARDKVDEHRTHGWELLSWKDLEKATGWQRSPVYQDVLNKKSKAGSLAELRPGMYAMVKDAKRVADENREAKAKDERRRHSATLKSVENINRLNQDTTGEKGDIGFGKVKAEAESWAGVPEGKTMDTEKKNTGKTPKE